MKMKFKISKRILSLVIALLLVFGMLPTQTYAVIDGEGWYISESTLFVMGKLTSLPQYSYFSINVASSGELAFAESEVWKYEITNSGTISGGTFQSTVENYGTISGGAFQGEVLNYNTISGGTFQGNVENASAGDISDGLFLSTVENYGYINGGAFQGEVKNEYNGYITGGTFIHFVTNNYRINGGIFRGLVTNNGYIGGGAFENTVANSNQGTIDGGEFSFAVGNHGVIIKAKFLGASVIGNDPQSVIHNVSGEDKPLTYGKDLLDELDDVQEGTAWHTGNTCISGGTVPLKYTEYTIKAHSHNYTYTVSGNILIETCANGCNHIAKATLTVPNESYTYTGEFIMPAVLIFEGDWKGNKGNNRTYTNNKDVGIATVTSNPAGKIITATFEIKAADIAGATITLGPPSGDYNGIKQEPTISVVWNNRPLLENTHYTVSWDKSGFINAETYTVTVTGIGNFEGETVKTFKIAQKEIGISWGAVNFLPYTGQLVLPAAAVTGLADGDSCEVIVSVVETVDGAGVKPGQWTARITGLSNGNYKLPENSNLLEVKYTIYANQTAPDVSGVGETVKGKNDGYISGLTTEMEYSTEHTNRNDAYTKVTDPDMTFAPGTYYVRYAAKDYYYASTSTEVTVSEGRELTVFLPPANEQTGYAIKTDKTTLPYEDTVRITISAKEGYGRTERFTVYNNGVDVTHRFAFATNTLTLTNIAEDVKITLADGSFADTTVPTAEITLGTNRWSSLLNTVTFGLIFKDTQEVTIDANDIGSGVNTVQYYLADGVLNETGQKAITEWIDYNGTFKIDPDNKVVVYARVIDNAGNTLLINSDGIVLDATAPSLNGIENGGTYYGDKIFKVKDDNFLKIEVDGVDITHTTQGDDAYKIVADNAGHTVTVTDKAGNVAVYKITVYTEVLTTDNPETGDDSHIVLWILLAVFSLSCIAALEIYRKKKVV